nr:putative ORF1 [Marmot picobirnavirus]
MTANQIAFYNASESKRHHLEEEKLGWENLGELRRHQTTTEQEVGRHNLSTETEIVSHDRNTEALTYMSNLINQAHLQRMDAETKRANLVREDETIRSNIARESETLRSNLEREEMNRLDSARNYNAKLFTNQSTLESNALKSEEIQQRQEMLPYEKFNRVTEGVKDLSTGLVESPAKARQANSQTVSNYVGLFGNLFKVLGGRF